MAKQAFERGECDHFCDRPNNISRRFPCRKTISSRSKALSSWFLKKLLLVTVRLFMTRVSIDGSLYTREIMAILGYRCIQTSARYTHVTDKGLRRAVEALAQRQTRTVTKRHPIAKRQQVPAA